jgi:hypothetical protein
MPLLFSAVNRLFQRAKSLMPEIVFDLGHARQCKGYDVKEGDVAAGKDNWYQRVHPGAWVGVCVWGGGGGGNWHVCVSGGKLVCKARAAGAEV